jgi:hypothetical protein
MNRKILIVTVLLTALGVLFVIFSRSENFRTREPITIEGFASISEVSLDGLISESDLIVVGKVDSDIPSRWNTADGKRPDSVTTINISSKYTIFTDQLFLPSTVIKGDDKDKGLVRIRHFGGQVEQDIMTISSKAPLEVDQSYLLFLVVDTLGTTAEIDQGHYIVLGAIQGVYKLDGDKAISYRDEWLLEELIAYIQNSLSQTP